LEQLARTLQNLSLVTDTGREVLGLITAYAKTWRLLLQYDEDRLAPPEGCQPSRGVLDYATASAAIVELKASLLECGEATALFGRERGDALAALLGNIEQSMFGESLYKSREEKAAHLLYFTIKNHPFTDGNKRIGSFLFILYLRHEGIASAINDNTLTALALLVAESNPANKDLLLRLIVNLLAGGNSSAESLPPQCTSCVDISRPSAASWILPLGPPRKCAPALRVLAYPSGSAATRTLLEIRLSPTPPKPPSATQCACPPGHPRPAPAGRRSRIARRHLARRRPPTGRRHRRRGRPYR